MEWISVKDFLPEIGDVVISYSEEEGIRQTRYTTYQKGSIGYLEGKKECWFEYITNRNYAMRHKATHWARLPEPPKD